LEWCGITLVHRERYIYIVRLDGTVFRSHNCEFVRVFDDIRSDEEIVTINPAHDASERHSM
jgi:hypothetical protein